MIQFSLGTRIIYDRNTLLSLRNSPLSRTPPAKLAFVAGVTGASLPHQAGSMHGRTHLNVETHDSDSDDDEDSDDEKRNAVAKAQEEEDAKGKSGFMEYSQGLGVAALASFANKL